MKVRRKRFELENEFAPVAKLMKAVLNVMVELVIVSYCNSELTLRPDDVGIMNT